MSGFVFDGSSWADVARALREDGERRRQLTRALAAEPHAAFAWETVPVSAATRDRPYEQVVVPSPALARVAPDRVPFASRFPAARDGVCTFRNLGGDAVLVAPAPTAGVADETYTHIAAFVRGAPPEQIDALWAAVGRAVEEHWEASEAPVWVSTAGLGVHWLHVRLDARPKYYRHAPFRAFG